MVSMKRRREVGLVVPAKYKVMTKSKKMAKILLDNLNRKKDKHENFELLITEADIVKKGTKCFVELKQKL